jgi:hypothetical protein
VLQSVVVCARCSAVSSSSTCIPQNTVWQQLFSVLQTLLQIFRDVTKTSFTFKVSCSFTQHAYCAFVYKIGAAFLEPIFTKIASAQQHYIEFHPYLELSTGSSVCKDFTLPSNVTYRWCRFSWSAQW